MYTILYEFFYYLINNDLSETTTTNYSNLMEMEFKVGEHAIAFGDWLALILSSISFIFIIVLCCLFVWKIIKLIGGLIR